MNDQVNDQVNDQMNDHKSWTKSSHQDFTPTMTKLGLSPDSANTENWPRFRNRGNRSLHTHTHNKVLCGTKAKLLSQLNCLPIGFLQNKSRNSDSQD
jgi:hypothetical protein